MTGVAVATTSQLAADAAAEVADLGGNAVDCAIAASLLTINTEPGVCALAGSAFVTVWAPGQEPITVDGNVAVPGIGASEQIDMASVPAVTMEYGGGISTLVGCPSVAVPGTLAALERACQKFGRTAWRNLVAPTARAVREGFPLSSACHHYLEYSGDVIYGRSKDGFNALHDAAGHLIAVGDCVRIPHLADTLEAIAHEGSELFYEGELGRHLVEHVQAGGGLLSLQDLQDYVAKLRPALTCEVADWTIATNPAPAVGGAVLSAMLLAFANRRTSRWSEDAIRHLINVQRAALSYRIDELDLADDVKQAASALLAQARTGELISRYASASTVHTSAVDDSGLACAITASSGYGSGEMPADTGLWLNNCLGELELNRRGFDAGPPGARLPSNMAPSIARKEGSVLAVGSPGADRITTALHQFLTNFITMDMPLVEAVNHPRMHLELAGAEPTLAVEPGIVLPDISLRIREYRDIGMYFGGVGAALYSPADGFSVAADPRRAGAMMIAR